MYHPRVVDVTERNISQFLEGSFGLLSSHDSGIPVYRRIVLTPDFLIGVGTASDDEDMETKCSGWCKNKFHL
jgi:hypothetical protein